MINLNINVKDLTVENIGKWPKPIKIGVITIIALFVFLLGYYLLISANIEQHNVLVAKEGELKSEFEKLHNLASNLDAYHHQIKIMEERFTHILLQLPSQNEMPSLLEDISRTGIATGLTFELFAPAPEVSHDFYIELPIQIIVNGTYQQLAIFLSRVAEMNRIVTLHDFVIEAPQLNKDKKINPDILTMKLTATIYRYRMK